MLIYHIVNQLTLEERRNAFMKKLSANTVIVMKMMGMCMCGMCMFCREIFSNALSIMRIQPC